MKLKEFLEEYLKTVKSPYHWGKKYIEVFVNPTTKEIREFKTEGVRFIIDFKEKKIYVFEASTIHEVVFKELNVQKDKKTGLYKNVYFGYGKVNENGKIVSTIVKRPVPKERWLKKYLEYKE